MINSLKYSVTFPTTGKTFKGDYEFAEGLTGIIGSNEAGKSLILEFIRFMLFGSEALRGSADHYKTFKGACNLTVKGKVYDVTRAKNKAELRCGEVLAVGTTAVNALIPQILGFGLRVFDTACSCGQGEIEALGAMQPTERKRMVDSVIGIGVIDELVKWAGEEGLLRTRLADSLQDGLREPVVPVVPEGYQPAGEIDETLVGLRQAKTKKDILLGWLSQTRQPPAPVAECDIKDSVSTLLPIVEARTKLVNDKALLQARLAGMPKVPTGVTAGTIDDAKLKLKNADESRDKAKFLREHKGDMVGKYTREQLEGWTADWVKLGRIAEAGRIEAELEEYLTHDMTSCPSCHHKWHDENTAQRIDQLRTELYGCGEIDNPPAKPPLALLGIERAFQQLDHWESVADDWKLFAEVSDDPPPAPYNWRQIADMLSALELAGERAAIAAQIAEITIPNDRTADLAVRQKYEAAVAAAVAATTQYNTWCLEKLNKEHELKEYDGIEELIAQLHVLWLSCVSYERSKIDYDTLGKAFLKGQEEVFKLRVEAEGWKRGKASLQLLKAKIKQHLVPSLNTVASYLLNQMTNGKRTVVAVDEDFNIEIDGQPLATLSGSGKAVANLAIRIGLGQVLTNGVMSLFMADEIDAAMDDERAEATAECLQNLTKTIKQIFLVSHKTPEADQYVEV